MPDRFRRSDSPLDRALGRGTGYVGSGRVSGPGAYSVGANRAPRQQSRPAERYEDEAPRRGVQIGTKVFKRVRGEIGDSPSKRTRRATNGGRYDALGADTTANIRLANRTAGRSGQTYEQRENQRRELEAQRRRRFETFYGR